MDVLIIYSDIGNLNDKNLVWIIGPYFIAKQYLTDLLCGWKTIKSVSAGSFNGVWLYNRLPDDTSINLMKLYWLICTHKKRCNYEIMRWVCGFIGWQKDVEQGQAWIQIWTHVAEEQNTITKTQLEWDSSTTCILTLLLNIFIVV